ncbi:HAMP domain-containing sensor histidine kinase [Dactylosporangium sp. NPDC051484]|uniref:sensor histidine kinase n=1 Tax=Dactylosporangium sp. NPDC051484 TaxID=3154942 RepID=UPI00344E1C9F
MRTPAATPGEAADRAMLARARLVLGLQAAAAITISLLLVGSLALFVVRRGQSSQIENVLRHTAATEEDVIDPPPGVWLFDQAPDGSVTGSPGAPDGLPDHAAIAQVRAGGTAGTNDLDTEDGDFRVLTERRGDHVVQVVANLGNQHAEQRRLLAALGLSELAGLGIAFVFAVVLARRATAPLVDALSRQRRFVADAGHELRTPLTQLHLRAQLLHADLRAGTTGPSVTDDVEQLVVGTRRLGELVEDLLMSTQLPNRPGETAPVDLAAVAAGVVAEHANRAREQGVELTLVPDAAGASTVRGRAVALRRVVTALVDNALSHTPAGGHVTVELASIGSPRRVSLVVRDDGLGFDPADAERLFARFARGHGDHRRFGLGLALAREVVTGHGGTIEAWGRPGEGAAFTVVLPAASA